MGGMNQNRYAAAHAVSGNHHYPAANSKQGGDVGFGALPDYQYPSKRPTSSSYPNNQLGAAPRQQIRPRQHNVPAAPQEQPLIESPTLSQGSDHGSHHSAPCFHHNPYNTQCSRVTYQQQQAEQQQQLQFPTASHQQEEPTSGNSSMGYDSTHGYYAEQQQVEEAPAKSLLPYGTLHGHLEGYVSFVPYPTEEFVNPNKPIQVPCEGNMSRVFLGQLPYQVTDMQLDWLCFAFGSGGAVYFPERITKHDPMRGCKVPTGCIHAYANSDDVTPMLNAMHKRILVDDTGVWYAETPEQQSVLNDYCLMMKTDRTKRYQNRPYDTVVAQFATSSFVRRR